MRHVFSLSLLLLALSLPSKGDEIPQALQDWAADYRAPGIAQKDKCKVLSCETLGSGYLIEMNEVFAGQQWTPSLPQQIYAQLRSILGEKPITVMAAGRPIEQLAPYAPLPEAARTYTANFSGTPWVQSLSVPFSFSYGLAGRHISLWGSHGKYWKEEKGEWSWQRPYMNGVREDIISRWIAYDLVTPMLEGAGAVVWSPRERSQCATELIVDNDVSGEEEYLEINGKQGWSSCGEGFAPLSSLVQGLNPFQLGTARKAAAPKSKRGLSIATWRPSLQRAERLPVWVSYKTVEGSTSCAVYTVRHTGIETKVQVNQQMGGSTWVYIGEYLFEPNNPAGNCVLLSNQTADGGVVTADAVRFGAGYGNIDRGGDVSGELRAMEGARYSMQWAGMADSIYSLSGGESDYRDDINVRGLATNRLCAGSVYNPEETGYGVPIELSVALHTDAGIDPNGGMIGTLGIVTTTAQEGLLGTGCSRMMSRDLSEEILTSIADDMPRAVGRWRRRALWDRNYSETRIPVVPSTIIEMLSHESEVDAAMMCDEEVRFNLARAIYKGILRFIRRSHGLPEGIVQPLPVSDLKEQDGIVSWQSTPDPLEPTAIPSHYLVQVSVGGADWDNGTLVSDTSIRLNVQKGQAVKVQVRAVNAGGASLPKSIDCKE